MRRDVFQAIADPVRRGIIELLADEQLTINAVAKKFDVSRPAISKHLKILEECGIVEIHQQGRVRLCRIQPQNLVPAFIWLEQYRKLWDEKLNSFEDYLMDLNHKQRTDESTR